jgi:hypothetical protein
MMLSWIFTRRDAVLTCELATNGKGGYDVSLVPHWDVTATAIDQFDAVVSALRHHAELARQLRDNGWTLAERRRSPFRAA